MRDGLPEVDDAPVDLGTDDPVLPARVTIPHPAGVDRPPLSEPEPAPTRSGRALHYRRRSYHWVLSWFLILVVAGGFAFGLRLFVVQTFYVPTGSMIPNLLVGDRILVLKVGYTIDRGSIVVFRRPPHDTDDPSDEDLVKRVIGLPGDTISSKGSTVYINGKPLSEPWLPKGTILGQSIRQKKIPPGYYFMMGDNRDESYDSRDWGPLPRSYIIGKVFLIIWRNGSPAFHLR
ncbi:MAG: signal peptidase I [Acidimicrobiales bacterium]|jgi:signal peptidase I